MQFANTVSLKHLEGLSPVSIIDHSQKIIKIW